MTSSQTGTATVSEDRYTVGTIQTGDGRGRYQSYSVIDAKGRVVVDALNSHVAEIHEESDDEPEGSIHRWDEQGRRDCKAIASALNAAKARDGEGTITSDEVERYRRLMISLNIGAQTVGRTFSVGFGDDMREAAQAIARLLAAAPSRPVTDTCVSDPQTTPRLTGCAPQVSAAGPIADNDLLGTLRQWVIALQTPAIAQETIEQIAIINGGCVTEDIERAIAEIERLTLIAAPSRPVTPDTMVERLKDALIRIETIASNDLQGWEADERAERAAPRSYRALEIQSIARGALSSLFAYRGKEGRA